MNWPAGSSGTLVLQLNTTYIQQNSWIICLFKYLFKIIKKIGLPWLSRPTTELVNRSFNAKNDKVWEKSCKIQIYILAWCCDVKVMINMMHLSPHEIQSAMLFTMRCCSHHVAQPHGPVAGVVLHQWVVVRGEERAAADLLGELIHNGAGDSRAVVCGRAPSCKRFTVQWSHPVETTC